MNIYEGKRIVATRGESRIEGVVAASDRDLILFLRVDGPDNRDGSPFEVRLEANAWNIEVMPTPFHEGAVVEMGSYLYIRDGLGTWWLLARYLTEVPARTTWTDGYFRDNNVTVHFEGVERAR